MPSPIDHAAFRDIWNSSPFDNRDVLLEYAAANAADMVELRSAIARRNATDLMHTAHRISGASQMVGAIEIVAACNRIEEAARNDNWSVIDQHADLLYSAIDHVDIYIKLI